MVTWKKKDEQGTTHFQFLCASCNRKKRELLDADNWIFVRDGDPASCNDCVMQCALTAQQLWGAADQQRFEVCGRCASYESCELQGRYYC